jgi:hypothetical protein
MPAPSFSIEPIYTTRGDVGAYLMYPHVFNLQGEWIGWVTAERQVFSVHGQYAGSLSRDRRILRKRGWTESYPRREAPTRPVRIRPPAHAPLPPLMSELEMGVIDVLDEAPDLLPTADYGELREDLD